MASFSVLTAFWIIKTSQVKEWSKEEKQTEWRKQRQQLQSSFALLELFLKSIFYILYTILKPRKSKIQRFKLCMIWSWNEEDMAFGRQLLQAYAKFAQHFEIRTTPSLCEPCAKLAQHLGCAKLLRNSHNIRTAHAWCEFSSVSPRTHHRLPRYF